MDLTRWTIQKTGFDEITFADLGIVGPRLAGANQINETFGFDVEVDDILTADLFSFGSEITVRYYNTEGVGKIVYVGYRVDHVKMASGDFEKLTYQFTNAMEFFLDALVFKQPRKVYVNNVETVRYYGELTLGQTLTGERMTLGEQAQEIMEYARAKTAQKYGTARFQIGDTLPNFYVPFEPALNITCGNALRNQCRWIAAAAIGMDYSTTPPTLHCKSQEQLVPKTISLLGADDYIISSFKFRRRDDLIPPAIHLQYRTSGTVNDRQVILLYNDVACAAGYTPVPVEVIPDALIPYTDDFRVMPVAFDFSGGSQRKYATNIETEAFSLTDLNFWKAQCPELTGVNINPGECFFVTPPVGGQLNLPRMLKPGFQIPKWMNVQVEKFTATAKIGYTKTDADGSVINRKNGKKFTIKINSTTAESGPYDKTINEQPAEPLPLNLAQELFTRDSIVQYEGPFTMVQDECDPGISFFNSLNFAMGIEPSEWQTMNGVLQHYDCDLENGTTTCEVGLPKHLGAGDIIERLKVNRGQRQFNFGNRSTGAANDVLDLPDNIGTDFHGSEDASYRDIKLITPPVNPATNPNGKFTMNLATSGLESLATNKIHPSVKKLEYDARVLDIKMTIDGVCVDCCLPYIGGAVYRKSTGAIVSTGQVEG